MGSTERSNFPPMIELQHFLFIIFIVNNTLCICSVMECLENTFTFKLPKASWGRYPIIPMPIYGLRQVFKITELVFKSRVFDEVHSPLPHHPATYQGSDRLEITSVARTA